MKLSTYTYALETECSTKSDQRYSLLSPIRHECDGEYINFNISIMQHNKITIKTQQH